MLPPPDFEALAERFEHGKRSSTPPLVLLGRTCGRLAGTPDLEDLARQALALLDPDRPSTPAAPSVDQSRLKELQRAFLSAFPTLGALQEMLSYGYGLRVSPPPTSLAGNLAGAVDSVFHWAAGTGQLDALVSAAVAYNPGNAALRAITSSYERKPAEASQAVLDEFSERFRDLSTLERYSLLQTIYRRIPVPAFYQELARLVKGGYVRQILTTNIDSLFEQALESLGLVRDVSFDVIVLGTQYSREALSVLESNRASEANRLLILKLHGDISQGEFGVSEDEIEHAVKTAKRFIKDGLEGDLVMVGYEGESGPLNEWLSRARGEFWWVSPEPPQGVVTSSHLRWLAVSPAEFFAALAARLLTLRAPLPTPARAVGKRVERAPLVEAPPPAPPSPPAEDELLRQEIQRLKSELTSLEQAPASTATALQVHEQVAQRHLRIRELEDQLRALPVAQHEILLLLDRVEKSVFEAQHQADDVIRVDPATSAYLANQVNVLRDQYKGGQPNLHVVSAALGAALVVAERLGPTVVDPQDVQALAAFGPTLTRRA